METEGGNMNVYITTISILFYFPPLIFFFFKEVKQVYNVNVKSCKYYIYLIERKKRSELK